MFKTKAILKGKGMTAMVHSSSLSTEGMLFAREELYPSLELLWLPSYQELPGDQWKGEATEMAHGSEHML